MCHLQEPRRCAMQMFEIVDISDNEALTRPVTLCCCCGSQHASQTCFFFSLPFVQAALVILFTAPEWNLITSCVISMVPSKAQRSNGQNVQNVRVEGGRQVCALLCWRCSLARSLARSFVRNIVDASAQGVKLRSASQAEVRGGQEVSGVSSWETEDDRGSGVALRRCRSKKNLELRTNSGLNFDPINHISSFRLLFFLNVAFCN